MSTLHTVWAPHAGLRLWLSAEDHRPLPPAPLWQHLRLDARLVPLRLGLPTGPAEVPALALAPLEALRLPARLQQHPLPEGTTLGHDARALLNVIWLLLRQLSAGQLLPALARRGPRWQARWRAVGWDVDALAHALPPACLAALPDQATPLAAVDVVTDLLDTLTDALARAALETRRPPLSARKRQTAGRWVQALYDARPVIEAEPAALQQLADALLAWTPPPSDAAADARLALSLVPPAADDADDRWQLQLALVLPDTPGVPLPAAAVWASGARHLQRALLQALARAADTFPPLEGLHGPQPTALFLSVTDARQFLEGGARALAAADVVTALPPVRPLQATLRTHVGLDGLLAFDWALALGDIVITPAELAMLAAQKAPLVQLRKKWLRIRPEEVAEAAAVVEGPSSSALGLALAGGPLQLLADEELTALFSDAPPPLGVPSARFQGTLRPYQARGLGWLARLARLGLGACLADDMGLGKTVQVLAHLCEAPGQTLLICPLSVLVSWQREAARFAPHLQVMLFHGPERDRSADFSAVDVVVTTYAVALRDEAVLGAVAWTRIVLDEAQHIKNPDTATSRAIRGLSARHRIAMTGTPVENRLTELWALFDFLNPGLLAGRSEFRARYAEPIEKNQDPLAADQLRRLTRPFLLRRRKTDPHILAELPDKIEVREVCPLSVEQTALYAAVLDDMRRQLQGMGEGSEVAQRGVVLGTLTKLKQICNHPAQFLKEEGPLSGRSGKLERLEEIVEGVLGLGEQMLIFSQFTEAAALICRHLEQRFRIAPLYLHGGLDRPARQSLIDRFQAGEAPVFVLSLKAAGTGLTLTAASHVVHFDRWWNPAVEDQATDRAWRMGQQRGVQVRKLVCVGTIEERIDELIEAKRALAAEVINTHGPAGLSHAELMSLVRPE